MVEINLLPWRNKIALAKWQKWRTGLLLFTVSGLMLFGLEYWATCYVKQKIVARSAIHTQSTQPTAEQFAQTQADVAEHIVQQTHFFLQRWQQINFFERYHIQLNKLNYADDKMSLEGTVSTFDELGNWIRRLQAEGLHASVQRFSQSELHSLRFLVVIEMDS